MKSIRSWQAIGAIVLMSALALPAASHADRDRGGEREEHEDKDKGKKGGVCAVIPPGCRPNDCRCGDDRTCERCDRFACAGKGRQAKPGAVFCRPCCKDKKGRVRCEEPPERDDQRCVPSPS